jgi:hypothetical protein
VASILMRYTFSFFVHAYCEGTAGWEALGNFYPPNL